MRRNFLQRSRRKSCLKGQLFLLLAIRLRLFADSTFGPDRATAAGRLMSRQGSGVILSLTATPGGIGYPGVGGFGPVCRAIEAFSRNLASELGPSGVRVVNIRSAGSLGSRPFREAIESGTPAVNEVFKN